MSTISLVTSDRDAPRLGLSIREAARSIGLSEGAFRELLPSIPHLRAGRRVVIPVETFRVWLNDQSRQDASLSKGGSHDAT